MTAEREAALRRIAIVLSSLPATVSARLLGDLDADSKLRVRRTMTSLADVDPLERKRALQAFSGTIRQRQSEPSPDGDEMMLTSVRVSNLANPVASRNPRSAPSTRDEDSGAATASPHPSPATQPVLASDLSFLGDVDDDSLVSAVAGEHPQTVALVLASIAPAQAARILPRLEGPLRSEAMSRIGRLGDIPAEMIHEIAIQLKQRVTPVAAQPPSSTSTKASANGQRRLDAIMAAMPSANPRSTPPVNAAAVPAMSSPGAAQASVGDDRGGMLPTDLVFASVARSTTPELRVAPHTREPIDEPSSRMDEGIAAKPSWSTDDIHGHLLRLKPVKLRDALASVDTGEAILALCGLPTAVSDAVMATLPKEAAKEIRRQIATVGPIELRDIDDAKERVAIASLPASVRVQTMSMMHSSVPVAA